MARQVPGFSGAVYRWRRIAARLFHVSGNGTVLFDANPQRMWVVDGHFFGFTHLSMTQLPEVKKLADDLMVFGNTANGRGVRLVAHFHHAELVKLARSVPKW